MADLRKYAATIQCSMCQKSFSHEQGKPTLLCSPCITRMAKPNLAAKAYNNVSAREARNRREGLPWGSRPAVATEPEKKAPKRAKRDGA